MVDAVVGAVLARPRESPVPSGGTKPMSFEPAPSVPPVVDPEVEQPPEQPAVQTVTAKLPPPLPAAPLVPQPYPLDAPPPLDWSGSTRRSLPPRAVVASVAGGSVAALSLLVFLVVLLVGSLRKGLAATPVASHVPSTASPPIAPVPVASSSSAPPPPPSNARFSPYWAKRALDGVSRDVAKCKQGTRWGVAYATVTFANDGLVDNILIGPPFTGTPTGQCVDGVMRSAHVPPFAGPQAVFVAQFYVSPR